MEKLDKSPKKATPATPSGAKAPRPAPNKGPAGRADVAKRPPRNQ